MHIVWPKNLGLKELAVASKARPETVIVFKSSVCYILIRPISHFASTCSTKFDLPLHVHCSVPNLTSQSEARIHPQSRVSQARW